MTGGREGAARDWWGGAGDGDGERGDRPIAVADLCGLEDLCLSWGAVAAGRLSVCGIPAACLGSIGRDDLSPRGRAAVDLAAAAVPSAARASIGCRGTGMRALGKRAN
jgi:hypothetical protein